MKVILIIVLLLNIYLLKDIYKNTKTINIILIIDILLDLYEIIKGGF